MNFVDVGGDSQKLTENFQEGLMAIYNGLEDGTNISFNFNNGVLDPASIAEQAKNTSDIFLQDLYEIATAPTMVELSVSENNTYMLKGKKIIEEFTAAPYDYDIRMEDPIVQQHLMGFGEVPGKTIHGNLGQTLIPENVSASGKSSTNSNVQVIINGKGNLNHRTVGIAHEFGHVILYLRGLPYGHTQPGVDNFVYRRSAVMLKRLGYDY